MPMPASRKDVETFVARQVRSESDPDEGLLRGLIDQMDPGDLRAYWQELWTQAARSEANAIPDWKTRERQRTFEGALRQHAFKSPSDDRQLGSLSEHVWAHLKWHIAEERSRRQAFSALPWVARLHAHLGLAIVFGAWLIVPLLLVGVVVLALLHINPSAHAENSVMTIVSLLWGGYLVLGVGVTWWLRRRNRSKESD